jgi:hypothetical protein
MEIQNKLINTPGNFTGKGPVSAPATEKSDDLFANIGLKGFKGTLEEARQKREKQVHEAASGLVAHALILPMLKQIRQASFNQEGPLAPGNGEKAFGTQFDIEIAEHVARSPRMALTESLSKRMMSRDERVLETLKWKGLK